ncbi:Stp1/IreP family PP2C-type Ser/Thr phosphatase [Aerococcaceae bacterium DSM 111022]|nr:Stp1/IreP family PP2C-type Ser/Thr phosphatase [Aerococcaceae bacterium DSM 111022]
MKVTVNSNIGKRRSSNQDYADVFENQFGQSLFVLCDGVGGNKAGDVASEMTTQFLGERFQEIADALNTETTQEWLNQNIEAVNAYIFEESLKRPEWSGMSTTLVVTVVLEDQLWIGYVGDSRAYRFFQDELVQLTEDHSLVNILIQSGEITKQEGEVHPQRNVVTQSIGGTPDVSPDFLSVNKDEFDVLMLCSDGLTNMVSRDQLLDYFKNYQDLDTLGQDLINAANDAGGSDNITLILSEKLQTQQGGDE